MMIRIAKTIFLSNIFLVSACGDIKQEIVDKSNKITSCISVATGKQGKMATLENLNKDCKSEDLDLVNKFLSCSLDGGFCENVQQYADATRSGDMAKIADLDAKNKALDTKCDPYRTAIPSACKQFIITP